MLALLTLLAQDAAKPPAGFELLPLLLIGFAFLIFMVLPMRRERRQRMEMLATIDKGDKVVINGAILGTVVQKSDDKNQDGELVVRIDDNVKVRVLRGSITRVVKDK